MTPPSCRACGHGWFEHYPPSLTKAGVSCLHSTFGPGSVDRCNCPQFVGALTEDDDQ